MPSRMRLLSEINGSAGSGILRSGDHPIRDNDSVLDIARAGRGVVARSRRENLAVCLFDCLRRDAQPQVEERKAVLFALSLRYRTVCTSLTRSIC